MVDKSQIVAPKAPAALGPYSAAVQMGTVVFCSGQTPLDPVTGQLAGDDVPTQTRQALANLSAVLEAAGTGLDSIVKTTVFLTDMADFAEMNEVYAEHFSKPYPARSTVAVRALPLGCRVEIEAIATLA